MKLPIRLHIRVPHYKDHVRHVSHGVHTTYFGAAFLEAHGFYAYTAGMLCILGIVSYFTHTELD